MEVTPASLASQISIVRWRGQANCLRGPSKHVADGVSQSLQLICTELDLVVYDIVVGRLRRALQSSVC